MKLYLICSNSLIDNISYNNENIDYIRSLRLLNSAGEKTINEYCQKTDFSNVFAIYSSFYAASIDTAKYFAEKYDLVIKLDQRLNDCKVGNLANKSMTFLSNLQEHDFSYKESGGESLLDVGNRIDSFIKSVNEDALVFTHKRCVLGLLLKYCTIGYNLDDELILEFNKEVVYTKSNKDFDFYEIEINDHKITKIKNTSI